MCVIRTITQRPLIAGVLLVEVTNLVFVTRLQEKG